MIGEYVQHPRIARDFAAYYDLFQKYQSDYHVDEMLSGNLPASALERLQGAPFDERLSVIGLLIGRLTEQFSAAYYTDLSITRLFDSLKAIKRAMERESLSTLLSEEANRIRTELAARQKAAAVDRREASALLHAAQKLEEYQNQLSAQAIRDPEAGFAVISDGFQASVQAMDAQADTAAGML